MHTYLPNETLSVELESNSIGYQLDGHLFSPGTHKLTILGKELSKYQDQVEERWSEYECFSHACEEDKKKIQSNIFAGWSEQEKIEKINKVQSAPYRFRAKHGRSVKPFKSLKVIESLGVIDPIEREYEAKERQFLISERQMDMFNKWLELELKKAGQEPAEPKKTRKVTKPKQEE